MDEKEDNAYAGKKWYLGILGDKLTDEVPGNSNSSRLAATC
jgi:hypothetical protein